MLKRTRKSKECFYMFYLLSNKPDWKKFVGNPESDNEYCVYATTIN